MKKLYAVGLTAALIVAGMSAGCMVKSIPLTPEGAKVPAIGLDLANSLPGRPLDKCKIMEHVKVYTENPYSPNGCRPVNELTPLLQNKTAELNGNCVIIVAPLDMKMHPLWNTPCATGIQGIALSCDQETLKAAGLAK